MMMKLIESKEFVNFKLINWNLLSEEISALVSSVDLNEPFRHNIKPLLARCEICL